MNAITKEIMVYLDQLLTKQHSENYRYELRDDLGIEVYAFNKKDETDRTWIIKIGINHKHKQVYIPNIFIPRGLKQLGLGKKMIHVTYLVANEFGYETFVVQLTDSFKDRLPRRGAAETNVLDTLQIVETTNLLNQSIIIQK